MIEKRVKYLVVQHLKGSLTPSEQYELSMLIDTLGDNKLQGILGDIWKQYQEHDDLSSREADRLLDEILKRGRDQLPAQTEGGHSETETDTGRERDQENIMPPTIRIKRVRRMWMRYAAALIVFAGMAVLYFASRNTADAPHPVARVQGHPGDIFPGQEGAVLVLSDGREIVLDSLQHKTVAGDGSMAIAIKKGELSYANSNRNIPVTYNKLITAKGREYRLVLEDGTRVWLNAGSSIRYPVRFTGSTREVMVTGETYFEVAPDKTKPFYVKVRWGGQEEAMRIAVLGTHFNVHAYDDEQHITTTLFEGRVALESEAARTSLQPGEQALYKSNFEIHRNFNPEEVLAWKNGYFHFHDADIETVMKGLKRWYDFEVEYDGPLPKDHFGGKIPRDVEVSQVLEVLRRSSVNFSVEGKKIIVRQ